MYIYTHTQKNMDMSRIQKTLITNLINQCSVVKRLSHIGNVLKAGILKYCKQHS